VIDYSYPVIRWFVETGLSGNTREGYAYCSDCGCWHQGQCPRIKAIEYYQNGTIKRIEYRD
jgi:hypothetical protein